MATEYKTFMSTIKLNIETSLLESLVKQNYTKEKMNLLPYYERTGKVLNIHELRGLYNEKFDFHSNKGSGLYRIVKKNHYWHPIVFFGIFLDTIDDEWRKKNISFTSKFNILLKDINSKKNDLEEFITYIAESSILVLDNEFNHKLIQFKDIDFNEHQLHNKYLNIIIHYRDDDVIDTFLNVLSSIESVKGVFTKLMTGSKAMETDKHEGCGITGTKCLTPRLSIKCFQLLNEELLKHNYKPDGSITNVSLGDNKGFMTQRYERTTMKSSTKKKPLTKRNTLTKKKQSTKKKQITNKRFPGTGKKITNNKRKKGLSHNNIRKLRANILSPKKVVRSNSGKGNSQELGGGFRKRRKRSKHKNAYSAKI